MTRALDRPLGSAAFGLLLLSAANPGTAFAEMADKTAVSRTAEVDGVTFRYLTAGRGAPLILFHGYAESSRMWRLANEVADAAPGDRRREGPRRRTG